MRSWLTYLFFTLKTPWLVEAEEIRREKKKAKMRKKAKEGMKKSMAMKKMIID